MEMSEYQSRAESTAIYPGQGEDSGLTYAILGLIGESGELANHWKKYFRDGLELEDIRKRIAAELGDVLWYVANASTELGYSLDEIAQANLDKLNVRKNADALHGSGDNR